MVAPTFVASYASAFDSPSSASKSATVTTSAGDVLVVCAAFEAPHATFFPNSPTGNSLSWTKKVTVDAVTSRDDLAIWTATDAVGGTNWTLTVTANEALPYWGFVVYRFSGSGGIGASVGTTVTSAAGTASITTTGANSSIVAFVSDYNAVDATTRTWATINGSTPTAGNTLERHYSRFSSHYANVSAYWADVGTAGATTAGLSLPTATWTVGLVEVLGRSGTPATVAAAPCAATGDAPVLVVSARATVTAAPCAGTGDAPVPIVVARATIAAPPCAGAADVPLPILTGRASGLAPPCSATADIPATVAAARTAVVALPAAGTADAPAPAVTIRATIPTAPCPATADAPVPGISAGSASSASVTAVPATATADPAAPAVAARAVQPVQLGDATADFPAPAVAARATTRAAPCAAVADAPSPAVTAGSHIPATVVAVPAGAAVDLPAPAVTARATTPVTPADAVEDLPAPVVTGGAVVAATIGGAVGTSTAPAPNVTTAATILALPCPGLAALPAPRIRIGAPRDITVTATIRPSPWRARIRTTGGRMEERRADTTEWLTFDLTADADISSDIVQVSFDDGTTWYPTQNVTGGVRLMPGPEGGDLVLPVGALAPILRIYDSPETPVIPAGVLVVT